MLLPAVKVPTLVVDCSAATALSMAVNVQETPPRFEKTTIRRQAMIVVVVVRRQARTQTLTTTRLQKKRKIAVQRRKWKENVCAWVRQHRGTDVLGKGR